MLVLSRWKALSSFSSVSSISRVECSPRRFPQKNAHLRKISSIFLGFRNLNQITDRRKFSSSLPKEKVIEETKQVLKPVELKELVNDNISVENQISVIETAEKQISTTETEESQIDTTETVKEPAIIEPEKPISFFELQRHKVVLQVAAAIQNTFLEMHRDIDKRYPATTRGFARLLKQKLYEKSEETLSYEQEIEEATLSLIEEKVALYRNIVLSHFTSENIYILDDVLEEVTELLKDAMIDKGKEVEY